jgi:hypothetical protein
MPMLPIRQVTNRQTTTGGVIRPMVQATSTMIENWLPSIPICQVIGSSSVGPASSFSPATTKNIAQQTGKTTGLP